MSVKIAQWVDMVFGFAQTGPEAEKRLNIFMPYLYSNVWDSIKDSFDKQSSMIIEMIMNLGSIPQQVFNEEISVTVNGSPSSDLEMFRSIQTVAKNVIKADFYMINEQEQVVYMMTSEGDIQCFNINFLRNKCIQNKSTLTVSTDSKMVCTVLLLQNHSQERQRL